MKIQRINVPVINQTINPISNLPSTGEDVSLREKISCIQKMQQEIGIQSYAASELDKFLPSERRRIALWMGKPTHRWEDFPKLEARLGDEKGALTSSGDVTVALTWAMASIVENLTPGQLSYKYSNSNLMYTAIEEPPYGWTSYCQGSENARINAAVALRYIVEKIGNSLPDEAEIIKGLLNAPTQKVRLEGAIAAQNTYKHSWRRNIFNTGLIGALRKEQDSEIREKIASAIADANPKAILETWHVEGYGSFLPAEFIELDNNISIKTSLIHGLGNLLVAQVKNGKYYEDFSESPSLSAQNRIDILKYVIGRLEYLLNESYLTENEKKLLANTTWVIAKSVNDEAINAFNRSCTTSEDRVIEELVLRLAKTDPKSFIKITTPTKFSGSEWEHFNIWNNSSDILFRILFDRRRADTNPLKTHFLLKDDVREMRRSSSDSFVNSNLEEALLVIDNSIENNVLSLGAKNLKWGNHSDFNFAAGNLIDLLVTTQTSSFRVAILKTFDELNQHGLQLQNMGQVSLGTALNEPNNSKLRQSLRRVVYSAPITQELLVKPSAETAQGGALILNRAITRSFKDYFGMQELKERALTIASGVIKSGRFFRGLLLSGIAGTGKSLFGEVLANELALPLSVLKSDEMRDGRIIISGDNRTYTIEDYFEKTRKMGACVLLIDEIQDIAPPGSSDLSIRFLKGLQSLQSSNVPIILIGTTNYPSTDIVREIPVNPDGTSKDIDKHLVKNVHPDCLTFMEPFYSFHSKSAGSSFAEGYINYLLETGKLTTGSIGNPIETAYKVGLISKLARGLSPADIISTVSNSTLSFAKVIPLDLILSEIRKLKENSQEIIRLEKLISSKIKSLVADEEKQVIGELDYKQLALLAEDIPITEIAQILNDAPNNINQNILVALFSEYK